MPALPAMNDILGVILGGGRGTRLYPLTRQRAKPAVPFAGKYRLIDIPISNCINSGIHHIAVLTQYNSVSLHRHISSTFQFDAFHSGWIQLWASQQTVATTDWYQGTADAVRKQLFEIRAARTPYVMILSGDQLYRMDFEKMARFHWESGADVTVAVQPVFAEDTGRYGILKVDKENRITAFAEKPKDPELLKKMVSRDDKRRPYLGSMGLYLFNTEILFELLESSSFSDFGNHIIPGAIDVCKIMGYGFDGYWEDIGTIRSFYETNLSLTIPNPPFDFFDPDRPIYTHPRFLPGSTITNSRLENVLLAEGCCIESADISHSVIGLRSQIHSGVLIKNSVIMGADYYDHPCYEYSDPAKVAIGIGSGCQIDGAIIDKNARIGRNVIIEPFPHDVEVDANDYVIREGIVIIPKNALVPPGTVIIPGQI
jgi:glucose-1-phosphate adenylyltransferase